MILHMEFELEFKFSILLYKLFEVITHAQMLSQYKPSIGCTELVLIFRMAPIVSVIF